ncbi:MAG: PBP1A family penicillin-binding protein [Ignavibacteriales bacterium]|nr:PBP1A family penicillin-binding protein [Ignavibacteriales bacterium]
MKRLKTFLKKDKRTVIIGLIAAVILSVLYGIYLFSGLPSLEQLENPKPEFATKVYSIDGEIIDQYYIKNRTSVTLDQLPPHLVDALIATEDKNFYGHWGVDLPRFMRAMVKNIFTLRLREGASTITQQLARNLYELKGFNENVFSKMTRKIREFITAVQIERNYTKKEILEMYLSITFFGRSAYGISSAAQIYFGKTPKELTTSESALLIALLKGPGAYDPFRHFEKAINRRNTVLSQMVKYDYLTEQEAESAKNEKLEFIPLDEQLQAGIAPHFVEMVRQQLIQRAEKYGFDIYRDGLSVYTTLDSRMQRYANRAIEEHLNEYQPAFSKSWNWKNHRDELKQVVSLAIRTSDQYRDALSDKQRDSMAKAFKKNQHYIDSVKEIASRIEVGFTAIDHTNGNILAMVGGSEFKMFKYGLNHVTQIKRQPGSAFKPLVYTVAIDNGYPPCYEILNQPVTLMMADGSRWAPENFDHTFGGKFTLREAIKQSINLVAIRAIMEIAPVSTVIQYAHRMGIKSDLPPYESLAIGTGEVQPLELISAFGVYANKGVHVEPIAILRIEDKNGNVIEENQPAKREVLSEETAYLMTNMMEGSVNGGSAARVRNYFVRPAAGKTGTTQEYADAWFVGFTPQITAGVWVGFDNKSVHFTTSDGQGGRAAAPIWGRFMKYVYEDPKINLPIAYFIQPEGVVSDTICVETKKIATEFCPEKEVEIFNKKFIPGKCTKHAVKNWKELEEKNPTNF